MSAPGGDGVRRTQDARVCGGEAVDLRVRRGLAAAVHAREHPAPDGGPTAAGTGGP